MESRASASKAQVLDLLPLGLFRAADAESLGFSRWTLARMASRGDLVRIDHGIYHHPQAKLDPETLNYTLATLRFGEDAVIGGRTALYHYALLDEGPSEVWVIVPHEMKARVPQLFRVLRSSHDPKVEVIDYGSYRMVTAERAIVEAFAYQTKIGHTAVLAAGRTALREKKVTMKSLAETATKLGREKMMLRHWEALTVR